MIFDRRAMHFIESTFEGHSLSLSEEREIQHACGQPHFTVPSFHQKVTGTTRTETKVQGKSKGDWNDPSLEVNDEELDSARQ